MTNIKLAYIGSGNFKFFIPLTSKEQVDALVMPSQMPNQSDAEDLANVLTEDLAETGLLPDQDVQEEDSSDAEPSTISADSRANDFNDEDVEKMDVSKASDQTNNTDMNTDGVDTSAEPVDNMDTSEENTSDMKTDTLDILGDPVDTALKPTEAETSKGSTGSTDSQHEDDGYATDEDIDDDNDIILVGISVPDKPIGNIMGKYIDPGRINVTYVVSNRKCR